jgi:hypothetical protein
MYLRVNLFGTGPRLIKKNLPGRGLTNVEKHWPMGSLGRHNVLGGTDIGLFLSIYKFRF